MRRYTRRTNENAYEGLVGTIIDREDWDENEIIENVMLVRYGYQVIEGLPEYSLDYDLIMDCVGIYDWEEAVKAMRHIVTGEFDRLSDSCGSYGEAYDIMVGNC